MRVSIRRLDPSTPLPEPAVAGDAAVDLRAASGVSLRGKGGRASVPTGLAIAIPPGLVGLVVPRSGLAARFGLTVLNAPGVIDSGYRGEIHVILINHGDTDFAICKGDRVAQLLIVHFSAPDWVAVDDLPMSERGPEGLGHTGVR